MSSVVLSSHLCSFFSAAATVRQECMFVFDRLGISAGIIKIKERYEDSDVYIRKQSSQSSHRYGRRKAITWLAAMFYCYHHHQHHQRIVSVAYLGPNPVSLLFCCISSNRGDRPVQVQQEQQQYFKEGAYFFVSGCFNCLTL